MKVRWRLLEARGGGRSTEEMRESDRVARVRREIEAANEAAEQQERERSRSAEAGAGAEREVVVVLKPAVGDVRETKVLGRKGGRNWWDAELDGIMDDDDDDGDGDDKC